MDEYQASIHKLMAYLDKTVDFATGQLPQVASEMLVYGATMAHTCFIAFAIFSVLAALLFLFSIVTYNDCDFGGFLVVTGLATIICSIMTLQHYSEMKKIELAPKLFIMQEMRSLVGGK